jgi:hypothetical protein
VHVDHFGTIGIKNESGGQFNFENSSVSGNKVGIENNNSTTQFNFDNSELIGNEKAIVNNGAPQKKNESKPHPQP